MNTLVVNTSFNEYTFNNFSLATILIHPNFSGGLSKQSLCCPPFSPVFRIHSKCVNEPEVCRPMVREHDGHDRDISPINNHQRDLEIHNDSHLFNDELLIV